MRAVKSGYGKYVSFFDITTETLSNLLQEMIEDKTYLNKAKEVSSVFKTNLVEPMREATFWIEYVCQFAGAPHLKSHAANMSWFSYLSLDILCVVFVLIVLLRLLLRAIVRCCCRHQNIQKKKSE